MVHFNYYTNQLSKKIRTWISLQMLHLRIYNTASSILLSRRFHNSPSIYINQQPHIRYSQNGSIGYTKYFQAQQGQWEDKSVFKKPSGASWSLPGTCQKNGTYPITILIYTFKHKEEINPLEDCPHRKLQGSLEYGYTPMEPIMIIQNAFEKQT